MNYDYKRKNKQKIQETNLFILYLKLLKFYKLYNYNFIFKICFADKVHFF